MDNQKKSTSNIPRLSRLPVRSSVTSIQKPEHANGNRPVANASEVDSINVSRSRPRTEFRKPDGLRKNAFAKPPSISASSRNQAPNSLISPVEEYPDIQTKRTDEQVAQIETPRFNARKPRPSLSERAIETLSQIPPSPSPRRRQSGFFPPDSPAIRPPSSLGRSRPVTSAGFYPPLPTSRPASPVKRPGTNRLGQIGSTTPSKPAFGQSTLGSSTQRPAGFGSESPSRNPGPSARDPKPMTSRPKGPKQGDAKNDIPKDKGLEPTAHTSSSASTKPSSKSSAALRETIANAKAARRAAPKYEADDVVKPVNRSFVLEGFEEDDGVHVNVLRKRINSARSGGRLNISSMKLNKFPQEVLKMYDPESYIDGPTWYESVDLTGLDASNNELENLAWECLEENAEGEDGPRGNIFNGLQSIDLHGNRLQSLPAILGTFQSLAVLNLSRNRLGQSMTGLMEIVSKIEPLRELHMGENSLSGPLPSFTQQSNLEILDLQGNALTSLPEDLSHCRMLRRLDLSTNKISQLPALDLPNLTTLNVSMNQISIDSFVVNLTAPKLTDLDVSTCRINHLPALRSNYPTLKSVIAYDNSIPAIDVESVRGLEVLDLRGNDLKSLPPELSLLGLKRLLVSGNPMRAPRREILEGTTERLMEWLKGRLPASVLDEEAF
ncbi:MAG: hypothetical protein Q9170_007846 [Blastenia crenularia]